MLIVKVRPHLLGVGPVPLGAMMMATENLMAHEQAFSPGLIALRRLERAGLVRDIVPLAPAESPGRTTKMRLAWAPAVRLARPMHAGALANVEMADVVEEPPAVAAAARAEQAPLAGTNIVQLERDEDVQELQLSLGSDPNVEFVSRVPVRCLVVERARSPGGSSGRRGIAATPPSSSILWNLAKIGWAQARSLSKFKDATTIKVAVLDTGIDADHPDLAGQVSSYVFDHPDLPRASSDRDIIGHGTHVAGTIAALTNNTVGINGVCDCELMAWKIFDDVPDYNAQSNTFVYYVDPVMYRRALAQCLQQGVDVINLSIGGGAAPDPQEQALLDGLIDSGTTIVAAMGNERQEGSPTSYPAAVPGVLAVGATSRDDKVANFSNRGSHISISAPGVAIWSTLPAKPGQFGFQATIGPGGRPKQGKSFSRETDYDAWDGTSMATPHVSGAAALLLANKGKMAPSAVRTKLMKAADKVAGMSGRATHPDYGAGRLNLFKLLK
jgi:subtilisin family serine protease